MVSGNGGKLVFHWDMKIAASLASILIALASLLGFTMSSVITIEKEQQQQNDKLSEHERRINILESMAEENARLSVKLDTNQQQTMKTLDEMEHMILLNHEVLTHEKRQRERQ